MYLSKLLPLAVLFLYCGTGKHDLTEGKQAAQRLLIRSIYRGELGVREQSGHNDGRRVEEYLRYTRLPRGNPWCAAFVCWCLGKAGIENPKSGWSPNLFPSGKTVWQRNRAVNGNKGEEPFQTGNVFGIWFPEKGRIAHVGFVDAREGSWLLTVEGNTNIDGSREGDGVYRKRRLVSSVYEVADWMGTSIPLSVTEVRVLSNEY